MSVSVDEVLIDYRNAMVERRNQLMIEAVQKCKTGAEAIKIYNDALSMKIEQNILTIDNVLDAVKCAGISYIPKKSTGGLFGHSEIWFLDLELIVGKGGYAKIGCSMDINSEGDYIVSMNPYYDIGEWMMKYRLPEMPDSKAIELLRSRAEKLLMAIAKKGLSWSVKDGEWKVKGRNSIRYLHTKPRNGDDWRVLYDPIHNKDA